MSRRSSAKHGKRGRGTGQRQPERREIRVQELHGILEHARSAPLGTEEVGKLSAALDTLAFITQELEQAGTTIARLRKLVFGSSTEKSSAVLGESHDERDDNGDGATDWKADVKALLRSASADGKDGKRRKGHGRKGASAYAGAHRVRIAHDWLVHRTRCPKCDKGKVYGQKQPTVLVRVRGVAPLSATVYELERLRCNLCGESFTAPAPPGIGEKKYDETAAAMIALLKYGCGLPFNRMQRLGANLGMPLPSATQWEVVAQAAGAFEPVWAALIERAAGGEVVHIDDTHAQVLALNEEIQHELARGVSERTGIFTSGVVSSVGDKQMVLFFTGRDHAGENLQKVLRQRATGLSPPIQMCDALSRNTSPGEFETIVANCLAHGRRHYVDVVDNFPDEVAHVLKVLREVYRHDAHTRTEAMSPQERLQYHLEHSQPLMKALEQWLNEQFEARKVEPNSSLGGAIRYMHNHWDALTCFLRVPGAPLDNNLCERALKRAIVHRKNSLFYKTENGAHVGDVFMSLIHTAELCATNPFDYLVAVQRHCEAVASNPEQWMPWNYAQALAQDQPAGPDPPN